MIKTLDIQDSCWALEGHSAKRSSPSWEGNERTTEDAWSGLQLVRLPGNSPEVKTKEVIWGWEIRKPRVPSAAVREQRCSRNSASA